MDGFTEGSNPNALTDLVLARTIRLAGSQVIQAINLIRELHQAGFPLAKSLADDGDLANLFLYCSIARSAMAEIAGRDLDGPLFLDSLQPREPRPQSSTNGDAQCESQQHSPASI